MSFTILGTGHQVPAYVMTNDDISKIVDTSDEWISSRTGIKERRLCTNETMTELFVDAAKKALEESQIEPKELDLIICATMRGDYITPSQSCVVQKEIGARCPAFDVNCACSGFVYALDIAAGFFARKTAKKVLVLGGDNVSSITNWEDRSSCVLFGDGVGAAVLGEGDDYLSSYLTAKGDTEALYCLRGNPTSPFSKLPEEKVILGMNGHDVYKFAVVSMTKGAKKVIKMANFTPEEIDFIIPHQANIRIIEAALKKLDIPSEKCICNIDKYGNTSAGSIPIALDEANKQGKFKKGDIIVLCSFGAGLTTGSCVIRWNK